MVAEEVRKLAERSAKSAREIEEIIRRTEVAVAGGTQSVGATLQGLEGIRGRITVVSSNIRHIGELGEDQAETSAEVGKLLEQTNTRLEQNAKASQDFATMVQEITHTAEELARVSEGMKGIVAIFKI